MSGYAEYREVNLPWLKAVPAHWEIRRNKIYSQSRKRLLAKGQQITHYSH